MLPTMVLFTLGQPRARDPWAIRYLARRWVRAKATALLRCVVAADCQPPLRRPTCERSLIGATATVRAPPTSLLRHQSLLEHERAPRLTHSLEESLKDVCILGLPQ